MGKKSFFIACCVSALIIQPAAYAPQYAFIKYPVVNLYNSPDGARSMPRADTLPAMTHNYAPCPRINQALFNELFEITHLGPETASITIPWAIYDYDSGGNPRATYWVETRDIVVLDRPMLAENRARALPHVAAPQERIILKRPFTDVKGITYSVGTEFVRAAQQTDADACTVLRLNPETLHIEELVIPRKRIYTQKKQSPDQLRKDFVQLLSEFVTDIAQQQTYNSIPYVWGGNSFTRAYTSAFTHDAIGFHRAEIETVPLAGYDCSMLVLRFAHMVGIPYIFKTTSMLEKYGKKFLPGDKLQEGDIIWFQGHVVVVTDLNHTLVTQACGYENGVGKVETLMLGQLIKECTTWDDLIDAYTNKRTVTRLDSKGNTFKETLVKIFKLL